MGKFGALTLALLAMVLIRVCLMRAQSVRTSESLLS
jgi:hypothetical protein